VLNNETKIPKISNYIQMVLQKTCRQTTFFKANSSDQPCRRIAQKSEVQTQASKAESLYIQT